VVFTWSAAPVQVAPVWQVEVPVSSVTGSPDATIELPLTLK